MSASERKKYLLRYTLAFLVFSAGAFAVLFLSGKSFVWKDDGRGQDFVFLYYVGRYLRQFFTNLLHGKLSLQMYDLRIGLGDDVGAVFRPHPLEYLTVFVPASLTEYWYAAVFFIRLYLAGLAFSVYCLRLKKQQDLVLAGSMVYLFCGYVMKMGLKHPTFLSPMITLPLLLYEVELALEGESLIWFPLIVAAGTLSSYYFMYMCSLVMALYVLLRVWQLKKPLFRTILRLIVPYLLGIGISCAALIPIAKNLFSSYRLGMGRPQDSLLLYEPRRYLHVLLDLIVPYTSTGDSTELNFNVIVLPVIVLLFTSGRRKHTAARIATAAGLLCLCLPLSSFVLSGFSDVVGRWVFVLALILAVDCVLAADELTHLTGRQKRFLLAACLAYTLLAAADSLLQHKMTSLIGAALLIGFTGLVIWPGCSRRRILAGIFLCVCLSGAATYHTKLGGLGDEMLASGTVLRTVKHKTAGKFARKLRKAGLTKTKEGFYRTDVPVSGIFTENYPLVTRVNGVSEFNSLLNGAWMEYLYERESPALVSSVRIHGLDRRTISEELALVRYFVTDQEHPLQVPWGYVLREDLSWKKCLVYENLYALPLGYTYDTLLESDAYEALSPAAKELAPLRYAAVKGTEGGAMPEEDHGGLRSVGVEEAKALEEEILYEDLRVSPDPASVRAEGSIWHVDGPYTLEIPIRYRAGYECYLQLDDIYMDAENVRISVETDISGTSIMLRGDTEGYSTGRYAYLVNLGWSEEDREDTLRLTFPVSGDYRVGQMRLACLPLGTYAEDTARLQETVLTDIRIRTNTVSGKISLEEPRLLTLSIPWKMGWSAWVDGRREALQRVNTAWMGLFLPAGTHTIELRYVTPGRNAGWAVTGVCLLLWLALWIWRGKRR